MDKIDSLQPHQIRIMLEAFNYVTNIKEYNLIKNRIEELMVSKGLSDYELESIFKSLEYLKNYHYDQKSQNQHEVIRESIDVDVLRNFY